MLAPTAFLLAYLLSGLSHQAAEPVVAPTKSPAVTVTIELNQPDQPVTLDSRNIFKITFTNFSPFTLYIYKNLEFGTTVFLQDSKHRALKPRVIGDLCPPPPPAPGESIYTPIQPQQSVSMVYDRSLIDLGATSPGRYFATGYYFRYLTRDPEHAHPSLREKPLKSNTIEVRLK